nr:PREDICTED: uncharacterized protein LOC103281671 [Anolis carolinensis]|eukprot:XP_008121922.1 PREDICTED: uncharacterized protein LOC103281671 [Anolis carolinensis]
MEGWDCEDPKASLLGTSPPPRRAPGPPPAPSCQWLCWLCRPVIWCWNLCCRVVVGAARLCVRLWRWLFCQRKAESQEWENRRWWWLPWTETKLPIQIRVTGRTGDCEHQFLKKVSDRVSRHLIHLKKDDFSAHFLLVFCPVVSRMGTDMDGALEGLNSETKKTILVLLHHMPKEITRHMDTKQQAHHPAVVRTVHTRYTLEEGLYDSQVNKEAVDDVAEIFKNHCGERRGTLRSVVLCLYVVFWRAVTIMIAAMSFMAVRMAGHMG